MGVVYRAHHAPTDQAVALKILAPSLAQDQEYVTRFFREAGAAGAIDHANVIRVIDVGKHEEKYFIVMEYVAGETLDRIIERERRVPLDRATRIMREIASGLAAAHRQGIVHRDVKPGNIIVSRDGRPHLTDFGLARTVGASRKGLTIEGTFLGTPEYASPEQVEGRKLDHRTDIYSLGVTYFQLLSGTLPFLGESPMEIAIKRTKEAARPLINAYPGADPRANAIIARCLHPEQPQRYQSMMDLIRDLDLILTGQELGGAQSRVASSARHPRVSVQARRRGLSLFHWGLTAIAILLAFLSGAMAARPELGGSWLDSDADLVFRIVLGAAALLTAAGGVFTLRKSFASTGAAVFVVALSLLMLGGALGAGLWIDRDSGAETADTLANSFRALGGHVTAPVNLLALGILGLFVAALRSYEHLPGESRVWMARLFVLASFFAFYVLGSEGRALVTPFSSFLKQAELAIPIITATLLACGFGALMLTGYEFGNRSRTFGLILSASGAAGLFVFADLVGQPESEAGWVALLSAPFADLGRSFPRSGTLIVVVLAAAAVQNMVIASGMRRMGGFPRKR